jgi:hypothetical protein
MKEGKIMFKTAFDVTPDNIGFVKTIINEMDDIRVSTAPISATIATSTSKFYDDDMLDYLLKDLIQERAKEAEQVLKEEEAKSAKRNVKNFNKKIKKVVFNDPATIVFWKNGDKTVVKCQPGEEFDKEKGLALAIVKYMIADNKGCFNDIFKKWINE